MLLFRFILVTVFHGFFLGAHQPGREVRLLLHAGLGGAGFFGSGAALPATVAASARGSTGPDSLLSKRWPAFCFSRLSPDSALRDCKRSRNTVVGASDSCRRTLLHKADARRPGCLRFDGDAARGHIQEQADAGQHNEPEPQRLKTLLADRVRRERRRRTGPPAARFWRPRRRLCRR